MNRMVTTLLLSALTAFVLSPALAAQTETSPSKAGKSAPLTLQIPPGDFVTLCFHDVRDDVRPMVDRDPDAINTKRLAEFFDWIHEHDWHPISPQQILDAKAGKFKMPRNAVLISFDDGLRSIYTKVFPLLQAYHYPAMFALETGWLRRVHAGEDAHYHPEQFSETEHKIEGKLPALPKLPTAVLQGARKSPNLVLPGKVKYNGGERGAKGFVTWAEAREMLASGLVSFATHTDDLHHGILANPQGNVEPAAITRLYLPKVHRYESNLEYRTRIHNDLQRSIRIITQHTGKPPIAVVWPYGAFNRETAEISRSLGLKLSFGLGDVHADSDHRLGNLGRFLIMNDPTPVQIEQQVADALIPDHPPVQRAIQVDMDYIYDPDPKQTNRNLGKLLDRIKAMHVRTVYLQAFADPDGDGIANALYFPNREMPMRADLFNRVAWQLRTRAGVRVYAWLPLLAFDLPDRKREKRLAVTAFGQDGGPVRYPKYRRLSPFMPESAKIVGNIYADLGKHATGIAGVLIHDDAYLAEDEDATSCNPNARWPGTDRKIKDCHLNPRRKTQALIDFGDVAVGRLEHYVNLSNGFAVARNLYARVVLDPSAEARFAQALKPFVAHYDEVALMAMPYLDGTTMPADQWLNKLADQVDKVPGARRKVVYELQTKNWNTDQWIPATTLRSWMDLLVRRGAVNLGYYPDDFLHDRPAFKPTFEGMSLNDFPYNEARH